MTDDGIGTSTGLCPVCRGVRTLHRSVERLPELDDEGALTVVEVVTAHCASCGGFVHRLVEDLYPDPAGSIAARVRRRAGFVRPGDDPAAPPE